MIRSGQGPYYAAVFIARQGDHGIELLTIRSARWKEREPGRDLLRCVGGMEEPEDGGRPELTVRREVLRKTGLTVKEKAAMRYLGDFPSGPHSKHFFFLWADGLSGSLRRDEIQDFRRWRTLFAPKWVDLVEVEQEIYVGHSPALQALLIEVFELEGAWRA